MGILDSILGNDNQTVEQKVTFPSWYTNAAQGLIQYGDKAGEWLAKPYMGNTVAALDPIQQQVINQTAGNVGSTNAGYAAAQAGTARAMGYDPQMVGSNFRPDRVMSYAQGYNYRPANVSGGSFLEGDVGAYMDPFINTVERQALGRLEDQRRTAQNFNADQAIASGAFGGSRHGVREAVTDAETNRAAGELSATLRSQGYNNATNLMGQDMGRGLQAQLANQSAGMGNAQFGANIGLQNIANNLNAQQFNSNMGLSAAQLGQQAALANQQAGLQGAQLNLDASNQLGALTGDRQAAYLQSLQSALAAGNINQQQAQSLLNQQANQYNAMRSYPQEIFNTRLAALSGTNVPQSTSTVTSGGTGGLASGLMGGLGGLSLAGGLFGTGGALAGSSLAGAGTGALAGLGLLAGLSDENEKTNIEELGEDEDTGLTLYAYDYKSDVKRAKKEGKPMPMKRVGPMAQEIEKKYPGSTKRVGGKLVVTNLGFGG